MGMATGAKVRKKEEIQRAMELIKSRIKRREATISEQETLIAEDKNSLKSLEVLRDMAIQ